MSLKGVIFLEILNFEFFGFFLDFIEIYFDFYGFNSFLKTGKKGVIFLQELWADVARRGTRADATWHARPCGRAMRVHTGTWVPLMWPRRMAGPRKPTRTLEWRLRDMSDRLACDGPTG